MNKLKHHSISLEGDEDLNPRKEDPSNVTELLLLNNGIIATEFLSPFDGQEWIDLNMNWSSVGSLKQLVPLLSHPGHNN